jgi:tetratricopeptide (TPR) repeat protein
LLRFGHVVKGATYAMKNEWKILAGVCGLVIGIYAFAAHSGEMESLASNPADTYYNQLVEGFQAGELCLKKEAPPGLTHLADPYDPSDNAVYRDPPYRMHDLSYYKGRLYLYFGVTPALILFWPFVALTGRYLFYRQAVAIFCSIGFLASVGLLRAIWRRYFTEVSIWVVATGALALGLAAGVPVLLSRCEVYEVPISCAYMLTMLALGAIWRAMHEPEREWRWLAAASAAYGLAAGARPSLLFGAVALLVPVAQAWTERQKVWAPLLAATGPMVLIGFGLLLYNTLRFGSPFEFGMRYQLGSRRLATQLFFSLHYLWFNVHVLFLGPVLWSTRFPFVQKVAMPPVPLGHYVVEGAFGVLTNIPVVWLALATPLAWRSRPEQAAVTLRWFVIAVALLFGIAALTIGLYCYTADRYEVDFLPELVLLAVVGILGLERGLTHQAIWHWTARCGWGLLLVFSVAFNLFASVERYAEAQNNLGVDLLRAGSTQEAIVQYEQLLRLTPDYAEAHNNLGDALLKQSRVQDAIAQYEQALRIKPNYAEAYNDLGTALARTGKIEEAIAHYKQALRINPDYSEAHSNLGFILQKMGRTQEAAAEYEQALRIKPDYVELRFNLGLALEELGRTSEAIEQYQQVLKVRPDFDAAGKALTRLQAVQ